MDASTLFYLSKIASAAVSSGQGPLNGAELVNPYDPVFNTMADAYLRKIYSESLLNSYNSQAPTGPSLLTSAHHIPGVILPDTSINNSSSNTSSSSTSSSPSSLSISFGMCIILNCELKRKLNITFFYFKGPSPTNKLKSTQKKGPGSSVNPSDPMAVLALKAISQSHFHSPASLSSQPQTPNSSSSKFFIADILGMKSSSDAVSSKLMPKKRLSDQIMNRHVPSSRGVLSIPPPPPPPPPQFSADDIFNSALGKFGTKQESSSSNPARNSSDYDEDDENLNECGEDGEDDDYESDQGLFIKRKILKIFLVRV